MRFLQAWLATAVIASVNGYWLMAAENLITTERMDPIVNPGKVSGHVHSVMGGSNFRLTTNTSFLRQSECTSMPIAEDKSNYWFPHLYFQWKNGSVTSLNGGPVIYYLFSDKAGTTTAFPDDFRMLSGNPTLRTYDANSYAQQAITFLCLDFNGVTTRHNELPSKVCPSGVRAQVNFPSCWDGKNLDSPDHKSHVAFLSGGPDSGSCSDPNFPVTLPRIFIEVYWNTGDVEQYRSQAMNTSQPFVFAYGDPTGYGYHADFLNGWDKGVLQKAVDQCHCDPNGSLQCCSDQGVFTYKKQSANCHITKSIDEQTTGTLPKLPGNNPVQPYGKTATIFQDPDTPGLISPVYAYMGNTPTATGSVVVPPVHGSTAASSSSSTAAPSSTKPASSSSTAITTSVATSTAASTSTNAETHVSTSQATSTAVSTSTSASVGQGTSTKPSSTPAQGTSTKPSSTSSSSTAAATTSSTGATTPVSSTHAPSSSIHHTTPVVVSSHVGTSTHVSAPHTTSVSPPSSGTGSNNPGSSNPNNDEDDEDCDEDDEGADDEGDEDCDDEDEQPTTPSAGHNHSSSGSSSQGSPKPQQNNHQNHATGHSSSSSSSTNHSGSSSLANASVPQCGVRKFRHKYLRELKAAKEAELKKQAEALNSPKKRSLFYRVHHDHAKRLHSGY